MEDVLKYCEYCKNHPEVCGQVRFRGYSYYEDYDTRLCCTCNHKLIDITFPEEELDIIAQASYDSAFLEYMMGVKKTDEDKYYDKLAEIVEEYGKPQPIAIAPTPPKPKCPHCHSTQIKSISGLERGASVLTWGLFSKKINKSFKCNNCGYTW